MSFAALLRGLRAVGSLAGLIVEGAHGLRRLVTKQPTLDDTQPSPLPWRDVERQRNQAAAAVAAAKTGQEIVPPPSAPRSRYD